MVFESGVFLLTKAKAEQLQSSKVALDPPSDPPQPPPPEPPLDPPPPGQKRTLRLTGTVPPEVWNRLGTKILTRLRSEDDLSVGVVFSVTVDAALAKNLELEIRQGLADLGLSDQVHVDPS